MSDVLDILDVERPQTPEMVSKESILGVDARKKRRKLMEATFKRPEGMHRELYALLYSDNKDAPPLLPTDTGQGYKQIKAKLGLKKVRLWKWTPFSNPARKDGASFYHWRRVVDEGRDYPFARFNKVVEPHFFADVLLTFCLEPMNIIIARSALIMFIGSEQNGSKASTKGHGSTSPKTSVDNQLLTAKMAVQIPSYTDGEYAQLLLSDSWSRQETDHLFELCRRFDLRFMAVHDRWDRSRFSNRSIEDLKERYYNICNILARAKTSSGQEVKIRAFDADHERKRKEQLKKLYYRTPEQVEEEQNLLNELRKIEMRKKEREKKTQDLQKLITAADSTAETRRMEKKGPKKKLLPQKHSKSEGANVETAGIKFADFKSSGVSLRSQRMKLPSSLGQKKAKAIEQLLQELEIDLSPIPIEDVCTYFNELRSDMVLLYELKLAQVNCEFELQTLRHQYEALAPGRTKLLSDAPLGNAAPPKI